ncbi:MAG: divergent polysaccharide deacetylase family protein [Alphaproteobacteria bacterium]
MWRRTVAAARKAGHELMVHVSMEPESRRLDPGRNALLTGHGAIETIRRLDWALDRFSGYVGVNNHMGSFFTADTEAMTLVMGEFKRRGLLFVDSRTTKRSIAPEVAARLNLPFAVRDVFLDDDSSVEVVAAQLLRAEEIARRTGSAIAIGHPRPATLKALGRWLRGLERRGLTLAPISAVVSRRHNSPDPVRASR